MKDERSIAAVDMAIKYGEGSATDSELAAAAADAYDATAAYAAAAYAAAAYADAYADARQKQAEILRKALTTGIVERTK